MSSEDLWFGNDETFLSLPMPPVIRGDRVGYFDEFVAESGSVVSARSPQQSRVFELTYPWAEADGFASVEAFNEFRSGFYGTSAVRFADPSTFDSNVIEPRFASPRLVREGWANVGAATPSWASTAVNSYRQPAYKGTWSLTMAANATPLTDPTIPYTIIPIPPGYVLHIGCTGTSSGTGVVRLESWANGATSAGATASMSLLSETGSTRMNATVSGNSYAYAKLFYSRTTTATSSVTPISAMGQLWPVGVTPTLTGVHVPGRGHSGLEFRGATSPESYTDYSSGRHYKALTVELVETGLAV